MVNAMSDISFWDAMTGRERMNPQWKYSHNHLSFETTTSDGAISFSIQKSFSSLGTFLGFRLSITLNGCAIFERGYSVEYRSGLFGGPEKPRYSREYIYLREYFEKYLEEHKAREQVAREEKARKETEKKRAEELRIQKERIKFFGR
jgi:hypothetical protein